MCPTVALGQDRESRVHSLVQAVRMENLLRDVTKLTSFKNRNSFGSLADSERGIGAAANWIESRLEQLREASGGRLQVSRDEFTVENSPRPNHRLCNLVATLPGESGAGWIVVCAHYDSRNADRWDSTRPAPGANDNGSGVAAVLELARIFSPEQFRTGLLFLFLAGEEQGLYGSRHWAAQAARGAWPIHAVLNNDCIGNTRDPNGNSISNLVRVFSGPDNGLDSPSRQLARYIQATAKEFVPSIEVELVYRRDRIGRGGDHIPFDQAGFPAIRLTEMVENYQRQHQEIVAGEGELGDVVGSLDFSYLARVTKVNVAALVNLALAPPRPRGVTVTGAGLHEAQLQWSPIEHARLKELQVMVRPTWAPAWRYVRSIPGGTNITLPEYRIDHYLFGLRAVDVDGYTSPVSLAEIGSWREPRSR